MKRHSILPGFAIFALLFTGILILAVLAEMESTGRSPFTGECREGFVETVRAAPVGEEPPEGRCIRPPQR